MRISLDMQNNLKQAILTFLPNARVFLFGSRVDDTKKGSFARSSDILTQKVLKTLFIILQEDARFFIDRCNLCEKLEIIDNADDLYNIRKLRNDIVHEYCTVDITEIFESLLQYTELLLKITDNVKYFITNFRQI